MDRPPLDVENEIDHLYRGPLKSFVTDRNALVKELLAEKRKDEANRVRQLTRPSLVVWTLNQLHWRHPLEVKRLLEIGDEMRDLQRGKLSREVSRSLPKARQTHLALLMSHAEALLNEGGHAAASDTLRRVSHSLDALASWGKQFSFPLGRLTQEIASPALEDLLKLAAGTPRSRPTPASSPPKKGGNSGKEVKETAAELARQRRLEQLVAKRTGLSEEKERLRQELEGAEKARQEAEATVEEVKQALRTAQQELQQIEASCRKQRKALADLRAALQATERELERCSAACI